MPEGENRPPPPNLLAATSDYFNDGLKSVRYHAKSTDEELWEGCLKRHPLAQRYLYERYFGQLLGIAMRYTSDREEAIGVLNQGFLKIFTNVAPYKAKGSFVGWMAKIVFRTAIDHVRSRGIYRRVMDHESSAEGYTLNEGLEKLQVEAIFHLIQHLPPATRAVFSLYAIDGYKPAEIAEMLGIDESISKGYLFQARQRLQAHLQRLYE